MLDGIVEIPLSGQSISLAPQGAAEQSSTLALCQFVAGPENALVPVAVQAVLDPMAITYWPLVLYGPSGSGKSHLALGLAAAWKAQFTRQAVVVSTALDFARELAEAIETKTTADFSQRYRRAVLLVLEDIQHLSVETRLKRNWSISSTAWRTLSPRRVDLPGRPWPAARIWALPSLGGWPGRAIGPAEPKVGWQSSNGWPSIVG